MIVACLICGAGGRHYFLLSIHLLLLWSCARLYQAHWLLSSMEGDHPDVHHLLCPGAIPAGAEGSSGNDPPDRQAICLMFKLKTATRQHAGLTGWCQKLKRLVSSNISQSNITSFQTTQNQSVTKKWCSLCNDMVARSWKWIPAHSLLSKHWKCI